MLFNLTPHDIVIRAGDDDVVIRRNELLGIVRRGVERRGLAPIAHEGLAIPVNEISFGPVHPALPQERDGAYYIVSLTTALAVPGRADVLVPDELIRDASGRVLACRGLARVVPPQRGGHDVG